MVRRLSGPDVARRRFAVIQVAFAVAFGCAMLIAPALILRTESSAGRWLIAALPATLLGLWALEFYRLISHSDEMMRANYLRLTSISGVMVLFVATAWGVIERMLGAPAFPGFLLLPAFAACYGAVSAALSGRA
jgi:hypothetical protein